MQGKYGMAVDNLLSAEVVLAPGEVVTASEDSDRDLFWALRGGGGNFGVVTSFEYRTHPVASVLAGPVLYPLAAAPQLFSFYREFAADLADDSHTGRLPACTGRIGGKAVRDRGLPRGRRRRPGRERRARAAQVRLTGSGHDQAHAVPRREHRRRLAVAGGRAQLLEVGFFSELSDPAVAAMASAFERSPSALCAIVIEDFHGAVTRVAPTAKASRIGRRALTCS